MSSREWEQLNEILVTLFHDLNDGQPLKPPQELWNNHQKSFADLANSSIGQQLVEIGRNLWTPRSYEALRILADLRQRRDPSYGMGSNRLVDQLRAETKLRTRPIRSEIPRGTITGPIAPLLAKIANKPSYSRFQYYGWREVLDVINKNDKSLVIVAPTGSGKTEVFLVPPIYNIASKLHQKDVPRYVLIYPRVELLKDQIARVFKYAYRAEQELQSTGKSNFFNKHRDVNHPFVIGLQYGGIRSTYKETKDDRSIFDNDGYFLTVPNCPICEEENRLPGRLERGNARDKVVPLKCNNQDCGAVFHITIGKNDHVEAAIRPHILITTIESLDRLYLNPKLEEYVSNIQGIIFDEVHLYHSLYGAHVHNVISRIEKIQKHSQPIFKIASSATVSHPTRFAAKLFYGKDDDDRVEIHDAQDFPQEPAGIETVIFLQTTESDTFPRTQATLIQTVMSVAHGILGPNERTIVFTESIDHADRSLRQISDAEFQGQLWRFRTVTDAIFFEGVRCPATSPSECRAIYLNGECWRGIRGGLYCHTSNIKLIERPLKLDAIHSKNRGDYWGPDVIIATPVLEVGVDDERFKATIHYRPPRSVFSFLQRRGRAGRGQSDTAYTIIVLGRTPADEFYFRRRNRLMDSGDYELPLNPNNEVIREMHTRIEQERQELGKILQESNSIPKTILLWVLNKYRQCRTLDQVFGSGSRDNILKSLYDGVVTANSQTIQTQQTRFRKWIEEQRNKFKRYMELDVLLKELVTRMPEQERQKALQFQQLIYEYRKDQLNDLQPIKEVALYLLGVLDKLLIYTQDQEEYEREMYGRLREIIHGITRDHASIGKFKADEGLVSTLYDFFDVLYSRIIEEQYTGTLNRTEDMIKIGLQSLFYVGNYCLDKHPTCPVCTPYFVPDAYFQEVKPITIETWTNTGKRLEEVHIEDATKLGTMLLPYKTFYRYFSNADYMAVVRTTTQSDWVKATQHGLEVRLELHVEGARKQGGINPSKIHVVPIRPDREGQGIVRMCLDCYRLHNEDFDGRCSCNGNTIPVRLRSEPIIQREAEYKNIQRLSDTFLYCDSLIGSIRILGASVEYSRQVFKEGTGYVGTQHRGHFRALYYRDGETPEPIIYSINTKGITWDLSHVITALLQDSELHNQVNQYPTKSLDAHLILHTAAHMLHKAIAAISGVNDVTLEYAVLEKEQHVVVWERYEGGVGISEIIRDTLQEDPKKIYRELLASVLCPVFYSEDANWLGSSDRLKHYLMDQWALTDDDDIRLVEGIVGEVVAERKAIVDKKADPDTACSITDGCPACIHVTVCTEHTAQSNAVSRYVAEAIMGYFRMQVDNDLLNSMNAYRFENDISPVVRLRDDVDQDKFDVVRF